MALVFTGYDANGVKELALSEAKAFIEKIINCEVSLEDHMGKEPIHKTLSDEDKEQREMVWRRKVLYSKIDRFITGFKSAIIPAIFCVALASVLFLTPVLDYETPALPDNGSTGDEGSKETITTIETQQAKTVPSETTIGQDPETARQVKPESVEQDGSKTPIQDTLVVDLVTADIQAPVKRTVALPPDPFSVVGISMLISLLLVIFGWSVLWLSRRSKHARLTEQGEVTDDQKVKEIIEVLESWHRREDNIVTPRDATRFRTHLRLSHLLEFGDDAPHVSFRSFLLRWRFRTLNGNIKQQGNLDYTAIEKNLKSASNNFKQLPPECILY